MLRAYNRPVGPMKIQRRSSTHVFESCRRCKVEEWPESVHMKRSKKQPLAATCGCSSGCKWLATQVAARVAASGCTLKWLQVAARSNGCSCSSGCQWLHALAACGCALDWLQVGSLWSGCQCLRSLSLGSERLWQSCLHGLGTGQKTTTWNIWLF